MDNVSTQLLPTNDEIPENSENWCKRCNASKDSEKHQQHLEKQRAYNKSGKGKKRKHKYEKSRGKKKRKNTYEARKAANKCVLHSDRDSFTRSQCEECWWKDKAYTNLGSKKFGDQLQDMLAQQEFRCFYSGVVLTIPQINVDHKKPLTRGGLKILSNICITTEEINNLKHSLTDSEFLAVCRIRWEEHQAGSIAVDRGSILMVQIWNYQLTK